MTTEAGNVRLIPITTPLTAAAGCQDPALLNDWHVIAFSSDYQPGTLYPIKLLGRDLVAWRDSTDVVHVWEDLCIHRGARLSKGSICDDHVICPYHGWRYNAAAECTLIPAAPHEKPMSKAKAYPYSVEERYGFVWVCIGEPVGSIPIFPEWEDAEYVKVPSGPYEMAANGFRTIENFLDVSHFPFVHGNLNGATSNPDALNPYTVAKTENGLVTSEITVLQPFGDARGVPIRSNYTFSVFRPLVAHFVKRIEDMGPDGQVVSSKDTHFATFCTAQPIDETHCILRVCAALDVKPAPLPKNVVERADVIYNQDKEIVETQRPERIPADLRFELHHRSDLLGQKYRSWLRSLGITYGVI